MATTETPAQIKANYVRLMGPQAGEAFAELMQDAARLHLKWNEFLALFAVSPAQIETMNRAAPGFFYLVSEAWWDGIILYIFRLTDHNKKVLSLVTLKKLLPPAIQGGYDQELKLALAASRFAHDLRHAAHRTPQPARSPYE
jgi:AbiU2